MSRPPNSLDRQLEEILTEVERRHNRRKRLMRLLAPFDHLWSRLRSPHRLLRRPSSPGQLMLLSLGLLVVAVVLRRLLPLPGDILLWIGVMLFFVAFFSSIFKPRSTLRYKTWRGRIVDEAPISWWERLYDWLYRGQG